MNERTPALTRFDLDRKVARMFPATTGSWVKHRDVELVLRERDELRGALQECLRCLEPFVVHSSSEDTITITVRTLDVSRARAAIGAIATEDSK